MSETPETSVAQANDITSDSMEIETTSMEIENPYDLSILDNNRAFILHCISKARNNRNRITPNANIDTGSVALHSYKQPNMKKHAILSNTRYSKDQTQYPINGILKTNNNILNTTKKNPSRTVIITKDSDTYWETLTLENNKNNAQAQEQWQRNHSFPQTLSRSRTHEDCLQVNSFWSKNSNQHELAAIYANNGNIKRIRIAQDELIRDREHAQTFNLENSNKENREPCTKRKSNHNTSQCHIRSPQIPKSNPALHKIKENLHARAERKVTRIANWNINNGFDHIAIATIMAKNDIDILAIQEPRTSNSPKDDVWIATMRKELRKCKYELVTSKFSYLIFDEQTSGAGLACIIRQESKVQGRILSLTFKSDDIWEVHTVISIYAVTNPTSTNKYAHSRNSRKDINAKVTKALLDELTYLRKVYGEAPIIVTGDFQDTIYSDTRDNIGMLGKKLTSGGPLQLLLNEGFTSAYHHLRPNTQQVTRWNSTKTAGRHIDLQMMNPSAATLLSNITIDSNIAQNHIKSDHMIIVADYNIQKIEQDIINSYRTRVNFGKISGIKMRLTTSVSKCLNDNTNQTDYELKFDDTQFMSCVVQQSHATLQIWQEHASTPPMHDLLASLETTLDKLESDIILEDNYSNAQYDPATSTAQRKLVERTDQRRAQFDYVYNKFQDALIQIASSMKIITTENKHVDALCNRQLLKDGNIKNYGETVVNLTAPTSKIRSAHGDLKHAEATLRNLQNNLLSNNSNNSKTMDPNNKENHHEGPHSNTIITQDNSNNVNIKISANTNGSKCQDEPKDTSQRPPSKIRQSFQSLARNSKSLQILFDGICQLKDMHEENSLNESAVSHHRPLDSFSGRWNESQFSSDICQTFLSETNSILKENNVKQQVGMKQLDNSSSQDDQYSNINHWWNGPDLDNITTLSDSQINNLGLHDHIHQAIKYVHKLRKKAFHALIHNKDKSLLHNARMNNTRSISQRLNPKIMEEPEAHHVILNPTNIHEKSTDRCTSFQQCLDNTLLYHQNWMDRSGSQWEHHWFRSTSKYGHLAGVTFLPSIRPNDAECKLLIKQYDKCSEKILTAFKDAHSEEIFNLMRPPQSSNQALHWQWYPTSTKDQWETFHNNYWKAIASIPGKARHAGYTAATVGRLPRRWIDIHLRLMKMAMMLRILPQRTKIQSRVPIPKPKPGETRPLSLLHDDMCFLLGFITKHYAVCCEDIKLFPPSIRAYRQGMSTSFITLLDLAAREDAATFGRLMALTSEDEEKFFDRVSLEVQLAVLTILGFPTEGFLEMKAEEMDSISVEIHTRHGSIIGKFLHGLKQGSPLSCLISNLVLIFKHRIWQLRDPLADADDPNGYTMTEWNHSIDGQTSPLISMEGFCDDNSKWNMGNGKDFSTLIRAVQWNLKMAGDLSMVFKIGRRGDKTIIELFNISWADIHLIPHAGFTSIAWDFKLNMPTEEEVDCRVYLTKGCQIPSLKPTMLSDQVWNMIIKGSKSQSERSLGIWRDKTGDTTASAQHRAFLLGSRIDRLNLTSLKNDKVIKTAVNSLTVPIYQFGILENTCSPITYDALDIVIFNKIRSAMGYAWCDAKQLLFVTESNFGMGIKSISVEMLRSICRELEVQLNDDELVGKVLRSRLAAYQTIKNANELAGRMVPFDENNQGIRHMIMEAIRHIATYGLFLRDMTDFRATYHIESAITLAQQGAFFKNFSNATLGMNAFNDAGSRSGATLGLGDRRLLWSSLHGRGDMIFNGSAPSSPFKFTFSHNQLSDIENQAETMLHDDIHALYTVFEWVEKTNTTTASITTSIAQISQSINQAKNWRRISAITCLSDAFNDKTTTTPTANTFLNQLFHTPRDDLLQKIDQVYIHPHRLTHSQIEPLLINGWPLIIATDGGATTETSATTNHHYTSAGAVILHPPNIPFEAYINATEQIQHDIMNSNLLPWRARAIPLPSAICDQKADNAHAECIAIILMEEWLPRNVPTLLIMDSESERNRYQELRQPKTTTNRFMIRTIMSGVSKCLGTRLARAIAYHQASSNLPSISAGSNLFNLCTHAKNWCYLSNGGQSLWKLNQWDSGNTTAVWAIRSHQLSESFSISPKNRYKEQIIPNRAFVSANQWADNVCNAIIRFQRNATHSKIPQELRKWIPPVVSLGITSPAFIITLNGKCLDRSVTVAVEQACDLEFVKRLAMRPTQGLIIRLRASLFLKPQMIGRQSYLRRSLEGKTKTHTRAMYVDSDYRKAIIHTYAEEWGDNPNDFALLLKSATKSYKYLRCPCCVTKLNHEPTKTHTHDPQHLFFLQNGAVINSGLYGNLRHARFHCLNASIREVRDRMTQLLEDHLTLLFKTASHWGNNGFATLLHRVIDGLIALDQMPFHNATTRDVAYSKTKRSHLACRTADDWMHLVETLATTNSSLAHANFIRWPLVHQLAFIPTNSYSEPELEDGEYSPCDLISMGVIPLALQNIIAQFAKELGTKHSQDMKKQFLQQWQQVRAVALLRAISVAMTAGAQLAEFKASLINALSASQMQDPDTISRQMSKQSTKDTSHNSTDSVPMAKPITRQAPTSGTSGHFACVGISCSPHYITKTNVRQSIMCKPASTCRRCRTIAHAIAMANSIEATLALNNSVLATFITDATRSSSTTPDTIIHAISRIHPLPNLILPQHLLRSTKRNVFPLATVATVRLLSGTFGWTISEHPTSLDLVFNQQADSGALLNDASCKCASPSLLFVPPQTQCKICGGSSVYTCTATRVATFTNLQTIKHDSLTIPIRTAYIITKNKKAHRAHATSSLTTGKIPAATHGELGLRHNETTTHEPSTNEPIRPNQNELQCITTVNYMLSNFVVSYFFRIIARSFPNILYTEFLFDFVKRDGGWGRFVAQSTAAGLYTTFLEELQHHDKICIIPICEQLHWTILIRKFTGNAWRIFFADSIPAGSDQRLSRWKALFNDNSSFTGEWTKIKIIPQTELECGARVCLHGLCLAISTYNSSSIMNNIAPIKNLAARSRTMVHNICNAGKWTSQGWLTSIIGPQQGAAGDDLHTV